jgi:signal transduction histidine kinase
VAQGEGLLHDAQNLLGAVGLYCDLLSAPGVLKPEHLHYAEELRLVGTRSNALVEHLVLSLFPPEQSRDRSAWEEREDAAASSANKRALAVSEEAPSNPVRPATLRAIVERCSGLLSQVAGGRMIEVSYGAAATMPVLVSEEAVERILVNLVRNSATALERRAGGGKLAGHLPAGDRPGTDPVTVRRTSDGTEDETPGAIRIGVGLLINRTRDPRPWPFRRVRLTVEDSGCGMTSDELERALRPAGERPQGGRGIGLRVVRELVAGSEGELRAMSAPGIGTRMQIEWPVAGIASWASVPGEMDKPLRSPPESGAIPMKRGMSKARTERPAAGVLAKAGGRSRPRHTQNSPAGTGGRMPC